GGPARGGRRARARPPPPAPPRRPPPARPRRPPPALSPPPPPPPRPPRPPPASKRRSPPSSSSSRRHPCRSDGVLSGAGEPRRKLIEDVHESRAAVPEHVAQRVRPAGEVRNLQMGRPRRCYAHDQAIHSAADQLSLPQHAP